MIEHTPIIHGINSPKVPAELVPFFERERGPIVKGFVEREFRQNERDAQELGKTDEERADIKRRLDRALLKQMAEQAREPNEQSQTIAVLERALAIALDVGGLNPDMTAYCIGRAEVELGVAPLLIDQAEEVTR